MRLLLLEILFLVGCGGMPPDPPKRVVLLGDSITCREGETAFLKCDSSQFPVPSGWQAIGRGIPGNTSAQMLARLQSDALASQPDILVLEINTSDAGVLPLSQTEANFLAMVKAARAQGIQRIIVQTMIPSGVEFIGGDDYDGASYIGQFNDVFLPSLVQSQGIVIADTYSAIVTPGCSLSNGPCFPMPGTIMADNLHPTDQGLAAIDPVLRAALQAR